MTITPEVHQLWLFFHLFNYYAFIRVVKIESIIWLIALDYFFAITLNFSDFLSP